MRALYLVALAVLAFSGCSMTVAESVPSAAHGKQYAVHFIPLERHDAAQADGASSVTAGTQEATFHAASPARANDVDDVVRTALGLPRVLATLRRDLTAVVVVLGALGILNAIVVAETFRRRRMRRATSNLRFVDGPALALASHAVSVGRVRVAPNVDRTPFGASGEAAPTPAETARTPEIESRRCACGTAISVRSRTGRCRRCASLARAGAPPPSKPCARKSASRKPTSVKTAPPKVAASKPALPKGALPLTLTISAAPTTSDAEDDAAIETTRAVLTSSRVGRQTEYYSVIR